MSFPGGPTPSTFSGVHVAPVSTLSAGRACIEIDGRRVPLTPEGMEQARARRRQAGRQVNLEEASDGRRTP